MKKVMLLPIQSSIEGKDRDEKGKESNVVEFVPTKELSAVSMDNILVCIVLHSEEGYANRNAVIKLK